MLVYYQSFRFSLRLHVMSMPNNSQFRDATTALSQTAAQMQALRQALSGVFFGQEEVIRQILITLLSGGHALLTGMPGLGKTKLVRSIAQLLGLGFRRIQFTPDLMPADILGGEILDSDEQGARYFRFQPGPIFTNIVIADEINRTPPKTQAALLEAMGERQVTIAGTTRALPAPFVVLATRNPIESEGTYPLPEAQLDRFLLNIVMDYLSSEEEIQMVAATTAPEEKSLAPIFAENDLLNAQCLCREIVAPSNIIEYAVKLCTATRPGHPDSIAKITALLQWGAGSRASQALIAAGKANALLDGRGNVAKSDIDAVLFPVLRHRISLNFQARANGWTAEKVLQLLRENI